MSEGDLTSAEQALQSLQVGDRYAVTAQLSDGTLVTSHYVVHGVNQRGELVATPAAELIAGAQVPLLEAVSRETDSSPTALDPVALLAMQRDFFQRVWNATAVQEGSNDPLVILNEIADLDRRIVDVMDDQEQSDVGLAQFLALFDRVDQIPGLAGMEDAEAKLAMALTVGSRAGALDELPPACPDGWVRMLSGSGLSSYCRFPQKSAESLRAAQVKSGSYANVSDGEIRKLIDDFDKSPLPMHDKLVNFQMGLQRWTLAEGEQSAVVKRYAELLKGTVSQIR